MQQARTTRSLWLLMWLPVAALIVLPFAHSFTQLSFIDEFQHVDYLVKTQDLEHVNGGERVGQVAMREQACRGIELKGAVLPPCGKRHYDPSEFPGAGFNHTYADPPTYYLVTAPLATAVQRLTGLDSIVTAARSVGVLWLAGGLAATFALALQLGASRRAAVGTTLLLGSTPTVVLSSGTVTTDAPQLLVGGVLFLVALAVVEQRCAWWWLAPVAAASTAMKVTSLSAIGAVSVLLVATWWWHRRNVESGDPDEVPRRKAGHELRALVAMLAAAAVPLAAWAAWSSATALPSVDDIPMGQEYKVSRVTWAAISGSAHRLVSPVRVPDAPSYVMGDTVTLLLHLTNVLLILGCVGAAWFGAGRPVVARLALGATAAMVLGGPAYVLLQYVTLQVSYWVPGRYGLSILPAAAGVLAVVAGRRNGGGTALLALGAVSMAALLAETL